MSIKFQQVAGPIYLLLANSEKKTQVTPDGSVSGTQTSLMPDFLLL